MCLKIIFLPPINLEKPSEPHYSLTVSTVQGKFCVKKSGRETLFFSAPQPVGEGLFENVGKSYVRIVENMLAAFYPEVYLRVTNSGIGGNTSRDLLQRFDRDVVSLKPDWVSICIGINDVWRQFDSPAIPDEQVSPEEYLSNVEKMILSVKDNVKGVFQACSGL